MISELNSLDLDEADFSHLADQIGKLMDGVPLGAKAVHAGQRLWRARLSKRQLVDAGEFGCPPPELVTDFQRCNQPNDPMFYCAKHPLTSIFEVRPNENDVIYLSAWLVDRKFFANVVPPDKFGGADDRRLDVIATFMESKFVQPIHAIFSSQYKLTAAITDRMLPRGWTVTADEPEDEVDRAPMQAGPLALAYPSCTTPSSEYETCLAMRPECAYSYLRLAFVESVRVCKIDKNHVEIQRLDYASSFEAGKVMWIGEEAFRRETRSSAHVLTCSRESGKWALRDRDGAIF